MKYESKKGCTLIISTYNWPQSLKKSLQSVAWQSRLPNEVIIADDGSNADTTEMILSLKKDFPVPLIHLWQENIGRRKTRINNIAIANSNYEYLVFIDHDMILHPHFIKDHLSLSEKGFFLNGSRFLSDERSTKAFIQKEHITPADLKMLTGKNSLNKRRIPFLMNFMAHRYRTKDKDTYEVRGCNMSFWRNDLITVNGYDEAYLEWGREDSNIAIRLFNNGIRKKSIKFGGIGYHMHHPEANKSDDPMNMEMMLASMKEKAKWAPAGLDQYMK